MSNTNRMRHRKSIMISSILKSVLIIIVLTATAESRSCPILLPNSYGQGKRSTAQILPNSSSIPNVETRIVRGSNLSPSLLPYLVALFHDDGFAKEQLCTATIVASRTLTSAAHCFTYYTYNYSFALRDTEEISAYFGARNTSTVGATKRAIKSIVIHPKYDENNRATAQYDIAYLTLRDDIPAWNKIMKVNSNSSIPMRRSIVRNMGYGVQNYHRFNNGYEYDDTKNVVQQVDIPVLGHSYCQKAWLRAARNSTTLYYNLKPAYQLCAGYLYGGCSPCYGDSGGPLFQYDSFGNPVLLGIASLAHKCGLEYAPSVFVRVAPFVFDFLPTHDIILSNTTDAVMLPQDKLAGPFRPKKSRVVPSPIPSPPPPTPSPPVVGMDDEDSPMQDEDGDPLPFPSPSDFDDDPFQENGGSNIISLPWLLVSAAVVVVTIVWCIRRG